MLAGLLLCLTGPDVSTKMKRLVFEWLLKLSPPTLVHDVGPMRTHVCIFQENANKNTKLFYRTYPALSDIYLEGYFICVGHILCFLSVLSDMSSCLGYAGHI